MNKLYDDYLKGKELQEPFLEFAEKVADKYIDMVNDTAYYFSGKIYWGCTDFNEIYDDEVKFTGTESGRYGYHEEHTLYIPIKFFGDDWEEQIEAERKVRQEATDLRKEKAERKRLEEKKAQLEKLKKELGDE